MMLAFIPGLGMQEILLLGILAVAVVWPSWRISKKAGLPGPLGLIGLIPFGLLALLFIWALMDWPAIRRAGTANEDRA
jgi:hypothetical protein